MFPAFGEKVGAKGPTPGVPIRIAALEEKGRDREIELTKKGSV